MGGTWDTGDYTLNKFSSTTLKVMPLKGMNLEGDLYQRSDEVEAQINDAVKLDSAALVERASVSDYKALGYLNEECIVCLIRAALNCNNKSLANCLFEILFKRCAGSIYKRLKINDCERRDDAYSEVVTKLIEDIIDLNSSKADFLQVRFWVVVQRLTINVFKKHQPRPLEKNEVVFDVEELEQPGHITGPFEELLMKETFAEAEKVLLGLSERHLDVFILRHKEGWPIESIDPAEITLSTHFRVTPRTIRNWLTEGMAALKKNIGGRGQ